PYRAVSDRPRARTSSTTGSRLMVTPPSPLARATIHRSVRRRCPKAATGTRTERGARLRGRQAFDRIRNGYSSARERFAIPAPAPRRHDRACPQRLPHRRPDRRTADGEDDAGGATTVGGDARLPQPG